MLWESYANVPLLKFTTMLIKKRRIEKKEDSRLAKNYSPSHDKVIVSELEEKDLDEIKSRMIQRTLKELKEEGVVIEDNHNRQNKITKIDEYVLRL